MASDPLVTVLIPVHNCEKYIVTALQSVLSQTYQNLEVLIINDASQDNTHRLIEEIQDPRIRLLLNESNLGIALTLNRGLELARGEFVARFDGDDFCLPTRLEKQLRYMQAHPECDILGVWCIEFGENKNAFVSHTLPGIDSFIKAELLSHCPLLHPGIMFRLESLKKHGLKYSSKHIAEDYVLWVEAQSTCHYSVLEEVLLLYRKHPMAVTQLRDFDKKVKIDSSINSLFASTVFKNTISSENLSALYDFRTIHQNTKQNSAFLLRTLKQIYGLLNSEPLNIKISRPYYSEHVLFQALKLAIRSLRRLHVFGFINLSAFILLHLILKPQMLLIFITRLRCQLKKTFLSFALVKSGNYKKYLR